MIRVILFDLLLFGAAIYALMRGTRDAQIVAITCVIANFASYALVRQYSSIESGVLLVDIAALTAFTAVAMQSNRFWPLWVSGLQLTTTMGHAIKAFDSELVPIAYAAALRSWSYPILVILILAVWRHQKRSFVHPEPTLA